MKLERVAWESQKVTVKRHRVTAHGLDVYVRAKNDMLVNAPNKIHKQTNITC